MSIFSIGSTSYKIDLLLHINNDSSRNLTSDVLVDIQVEDVNEIFESISQSEGKIIKEAYETHWDTFEAIITDPDGYQITLSQPLN